MDVSAADLRSYGLEILLLAVKYQVVGLQLKLERSLVVNDENVDDMVAVANLCESTVLKKRLADFAQTHRDSIMRNDFGETSWNVVIRLTQEEDGRAKKRKI